LQNIETCAKPAVNSIATQIKTNVYIPMGCRDKKNTNIFNVTVFTRFWYGSLYNKF